MSLQHSRCVPPGGVVEHPGPPPGGGEEEEEEEGEGEDGAEDAEEDLGGLGDVHGVELGGGGGPPRLSLKKDF